MTTATILNSLNSALSALGIETRFDASEEVFFLIYGQESYGDFVAFRLEGEGEDFTLYANFREEDGDVTPDGEDHEFAHLADLDAVIAKIRHLLETTDMRLSRYEA